MKTYRSNQALSRKRMPEQSEVSEKGHLKSSKWIEARFF